MKSQPTLRLDSQPLWQDPLAVACDVIVKNSEDAAGRSRMSADTAPDSDTSTVFATIADLQDRLAHAAKKMADALRRVDCSRDAPRR